ncbi:MAG: hypothetical protein K1X44_07345 [Alphaproteobacteria bacterium]|nr:hypothetical protein [Alphaproteobacteria bacterium]
MLYDDTLKPLEKIYASMKGTMLSDIAIGVGFFIVGKYITHSPVLSYLGLGFAFIALILSGIFHWLSLREIKRKQARKANIA